MVVCFYACSILACIDHADNSLVVQVTEDFHLIYEIRRILTYFARRLQQFNCDVLSGFDFTTEEYFGRHALTKALENLVLTVEDRVWQGLLPFRQLNFLTNRLFCAL